MLGLTLCLLLHVEILSFIFEQLGPAGDLGVTVQDCPWHTPARSEESGVSILPSHPSPTASLVCLGGLRGLSGGKYGVLTDCHQCSLGR